MKNCLVTKHIGVSDDDSLLKVGEMRIHIAKDSSPTPTNRSFKIEASSPISLRISGNGYFSDNTLSANKGTSMGIQSGFSTIYLSNGEFDVIVSDKYKITRLETNYSGILAYISIDDLKYSDKVSYIVFPSTSSGDVSALADKENLTFIELGKNITGDISNLKKSIKITSLVIRSTKITGDISNLKEYTNLRNLDLREGKLTGNIGDLPDSLLYFYHNNVNSCFTWTSSKRTNIIALNNIRCDAIDKLLQDMSSMNAIFNGTESWYKGISLIGTRTSASDAAIATLQSKGYTVSITPA